MTITHTTTAVYKEGEEITLFDKRWRVDAVGISGDQHKYTLVEVLPTRPPRVIGGYGRGR